MSIVVCGSLAYDVIMVFPDYFEKHILPDQIHILNVSFQTPEMRKVFGGCAGNIAYGLKALGADPLIVSTVGDDAGAYLTRLKKLNISTRFVKQIPDTFTAQCIITTDLADNQITAFHPGAMNCSHQNRVCAESGASLALVGPDGRAGMMAHAEDLHAAGIPFVFDPGQAIILFSGDELLHFMQLATYCIVNDYESQLMENRTGWTRADLVKQVKALIVTMGAQGSHIYMDGEDIAIPAVQAEAVVDPTGCGDAYRAALLYGIANGFNWRQIGQLGATMGAVKVAHRGGQGFELNRQIILQRYQQAFGEALAV